jgi:hypothetical protein
MPHPRIAAVTCLLFAACGTATPTTPTAPRPGPEIQIPVFAADDARVGKGGFVNETLRLHQEIDGVRYTLMVFVVGETLTLGAMTRGGEFKGTVQWSVGTRTLATAFDSVKPAKDAAVTVSGGTGALVAHGAEFRGTTWMNVEMPVAQWLPEGAPLALTFTPEHGASKTLPDGGTTYVARFVTR